ncbi:AMP nucleosidase [Granulosicoccus antarcticus]|uniref:AMP nucleosidase n=1 Tax=Granulosicoccus antarcticus IMCC3135 TaxID=1192854 RepID=A0A2Z2NJZ4_9GAMM|nr:AMP nucleosidase [Granulosicoccus antarcticus]ASJ71712.1 AMP nucleosidase [Granulosicoccus antarcticus IMCC3135]
MTLHLTTPPPQKAISFTNATEAVDCLIAMYERNTAFLADAFAKYLSGSLPDTKHRAFYPEIRFRNSTYARVDSRLSYGHVDQPGLYTTTITQPKLFRDYLIHQLSLLIENHAEPIEIAESDVPIPLHFALESGSALAVHRPQKITVALRDAFDVPDIAQVNDYIVNGTLEVEPGLAMPLAPFPAQRIDYSLHRLVHYTATEPEHFQNYVLFTNYQFYIDEFCRLAHDMMKDGDSGYESFVEPGNVITLNGESEPSSGTAPSRQPQMPSYHLKSSKHRGITMVNIGVGPSNAKTITDHIAVLRPHAWLMLGHCAGLRNSQELGDYVLAHAYVREDKVLDADIPVWVPIPALAEVQQALQGAVADVTGLEGYELKRIMRTGTVASIDNRNWELQDQREPVRRLSQSRAIALDMESATIAANGFRLRVPYGTLLCVSDKPLQGELKLPGMATEFYQNQVSQHLEIGMLALRKLSEMKSERLHSRKLRSFFETAFQ